MEKEEIKEGRVAKAKGIFASFFGVPEETKEPIKGEEPQESAPQEGAEPPSEEERPPDYGFEIGPDGALYQLWRIWEPQGPPPRLSLGTEEDGLSLTADGAEREKKRIYEALERDAQRRVRDITARLPKDQDGEKPGPDLDTQCFVYMASDGMVAWVLIFPPVGDGKPDLDEFGKALRTNHISAGIETETVADLFEHKRYFELRIIARGTPAIEGEDGRIVERYEKKQTQNIKIDETGRVDYRAQCYVQSVNKGDILCDILPPVPGTDGLRVDGRVIKPQNVRVAKIPKGSNTTVSEDGAHLTATMDGHLEFAGSVLQVKPILEVPGDVDYSSGNVDFHGDVHIRGDVRENFSVRATGTVTIDGLVEAATVEAGGDIVVANGVLGDNKALLKSKGSVRARYLENCVVFSGACTFADCILASRVYSDDRVCVTSGRGTIIGGGVTAARCIEARIIGSKSGRETEITLGVLPYVQEERSDNEIDLQNIGKELEELDRQLAYLEARQGMGDSSAQLAKARLRKSVLALKQDKLFRRQEELSQMRPDLSKCRLECDTVYPVTRLTIGPEIRDIEHVWTKCKAVYDMTEREIKFI